MKKRSKGIVIIVGLSAFALALLGIAQEVPPSVNIPPSSSSLPPVTQPSVTPTTQATVVSTAAATVTNHLSSQLPVRTPSPATVSTAATTPTVSTLSSAAVSIAPTTSSIRNLLAVKQYAVGPVDDKDGIDAVVDKDFAKSANGYSCTTNQSTNAANNTFCKAASVNLSYGDGAFGSRDPNPKLVITDQVRGVNAKNTDTTSGSVQFGTNFVVNLNSGEEINAVTDASGQVWTFKAITTTGNIIIKSLAPKLTVNLKAGQTVTLRTSQDPGLTVQADSANADAVKVSTIDGKKQFMLGAARTASIAGDILSTDPITLFTGGASLRGSYAYMTDLVDPESTYNADLRADGSSDLIQVQTGPVPQVIFSPIVTTSAKGGTSLVGQAIAIEGYGWSPNQLCTVTVSGPGISITATLKTDKNGYVRLPVQPSPTSTGVVTIEMTCNIEGTNVTESSKTKVNVIAPAQAKTADVFTFPYVFTPGADAVVIGRGFKPGNTVTLQFTFRDKNGQVIPTQSVVGTVNDLGKFVISIKIPINASDFAPAQIFASDGAGNSDLTDVPVVTESKRVDTQTGGKTNVGPKKVDVENGKFGKLFDPPIIYTVEAPVNNTATVHDFDSLNPLITAGTLNIGRVVVTMKVPNCDSPGFSPCTKASLAAGAYEVPMAGGSTMVKAGFGDAFTADPPHSDEINLHDKQTNSSATDALLNSLNGGPELQPNSALAGDSIRVFGGSSGMTGITKVTYTDGVQTAIGKATTINNFNAGEGGFVGEVQIPTTDINGQPLKAGEGTLTIEYTTATGPGVLSRYFTIRSTGPGVVVNPSEVAPLGNAIFHAGNLSFTPGSSVEIFIDAVFQKTVTAGNNGEVIVLVTAPSTAGVHEVAGRQGPPPGQIGNPIVQKAKFTVTSTGTLITTPPSGTCEMGYRSDGSLETLGNCAYAVQGGGAYTTSGNVATALTISAASATYDSTILTCDPNGVPINITTSGGATAQVTCTTTATIEYQTSLSNAGASLKVLKGTASVKGLSNPNAPANPNAHRAYAINVREFKMQPGGVQKGLLVALGEIQSGALTFKTSSSDVGWNTAAVDNIVYGPGTNPAAAVNLIAFAPGTDYKAIHPSGVFLKKALVALQRNVFQFDTSGGSTVPAKTTSVTGSQLDIYSPESIPIVPGTTIDVPFMYESSDIGWKITTSPSAPTGCTLSPGSQSLSISTDGTLQTMGLVWQMTCSTLAAGKSSLVPLAQAASDPPGKNVHVKHRIKDNVKGSKNFGKELALDDDIPIKEKPKHRSETLERGSSLWSMILKILDGNVPTSMLVQAARATAQHNHIKVPEWGLNDGDRDARTLLPGQVIDLTPLDDFKKS